MKNDNNSKQKKASKSWLIPFLNIVLLIIIGIMIGLFISTGIVGTFVEEERGIQGLLLALVFISVVVSGFLLVVVHEAGHLITGIFSGYSFVSFRIFSTIILRRNGRFVFKRFSIPGTQGQCLMSPPEPVGGGYPHRLYNAGGSILNFITAIAAVFPVLLSQSPYVRIIFIPFAALGTIFAAVNIIPMKMSGVANDGYNIQTLNKRETGRRAFWLILHINARVAEGMRLRDMPPEWFEFPDDADVSDVMIAATANYRLSYLIDRLELDRAREFGQGILDRADKMLEIYKNEIRCEMLFLEIIGQRRSEVIDPLYTKQLKKYIKYSALMISKQQLMYAYAKLVSDDEQEAARILVQFEKTCTTYPNEGEIESAREMIALVNRLANAAPDRVDKELAGGEDAPEHTDTE